MIGPTQFRPLELGDPGRLDRITALVPNGWAAHDAMEVVDPHGPGGMWPARTTAQSDGWHLTIDETRASIKELRKALRRQGGYGVTHVLELRRVMAPLFTPMMRQRCLMRLGMPSGCSWVGGAHLCSRWAGGGRRRNGLLGDLWSSIRTSSMAPGATTPSPVHN